MQSNDVKERQTIVSDQYCSLVANVDIHKVVLGGKFQLAVNTQSLLVGFCFGNFRKVFVTVRFHHQMAVCTGSGVVLGRTGEIISEANHLLHSVSHYFVWKFILSQWIN